jgi:hypothetical protein
MSTAAEMISTPPAESAPAPAPSGSTAAPSSAQAANQSTWWDSFSNPDVKSWVANKKYESPELLASSAYSLERLLGADRAGRTAVLPKDEQDLEGLKAFRSKIGVPDAPDGYELPMPPGADENFSKAAKEAFHKAGLPAKAASEVTAWWNDYIAGEVARSEAADKAASEQKLAELRGEWADKFDERAEYAKRGFATIGKEAGLDQNDLNRLETALGTDKMLKLFWKLGATNSEGGFAGNAKQNTFGMTPDEAKAAINQMQAERAAGKINDYTWQREYEPKILKMMEHAYSA